MKTTLLKTKNILFVTAFAFFAMQSANAIGFFQDSNNGSQDPEEDLMQRMYIEFNSADGPETRRVLQLTFSENTSDDFDIDYDIKNTNVRDYDLNLSLSGEPMIEQAYGPITEDKAVPLLFQTAGSYSFTIRLTATDNMEEQDLHIKDNLYGTYFDLKSGEAYQFYSEEGYYANRFEIVFKQQSETLSQIDHELEGLDVRYLLNSKKLIIANPNNKEVKSIELYNILGQAVYKNRMNETENSREFQLNNLSAGTYIVRLVTSENGILTKKITVN